MLVAPYVVKIKYKKIIGIILTILFCIHQTMIVNAEKMQVEKQKALIEEYISNKDQIVLYDNSDIALWLKPYVTSWEKKGISILYDKPFRFKYGEGKMIALSNEDYKAFSTFSQMSPEREKVNGDTKFYYYGGALILANAHNVKKDHKFVMRIQNGEDPSQYKEVDVRHKFISTRWGDFVYAFYPADGKLLGVYHKK